MEVKKKGTQWRVYKPTKNGTGAASRLEMKVVEEERKSSSGSSFSAILGCFSSDGDGLQWKRRICLERFWGYRVNYFENGRG